MDQPDADINKGIVDVQGPSSQSEEKLRGECEDVWRELHDIHARLQCRQANNPPCGVDEEQNSLLQILQVKEMKLRGEITAVQAKEIDVATNPQILEALLKEELCKNIHQLEETLQVVKAQRKEVVQDVEREKAVLSEHTEIQASLMNKTAQLEQEKENIHTGTSQVRELNRKQKVANATCVHLMRSLAEFMSEHFPLPTTEHIKGKGKHLGQPLDPKGRLLSLQQIIEILMNRMYEKPHDPYIQLKAYHWLPYIELLLRCGIAQRHPTNCNLIRLVAFNR